MCARNDTGSIQHHGICFTVLHRGDGRGKEANRYSPSRENERERGRNVITLQSIHIGNAAAEIEEFLLSLLRLNRGEEYNVGVVMRMLFVPSCFFIFYASQI